MSTTQLGDKQQMPSAGAAGQRTCSAAVCSGIMRRSMAGGPTGSAAMASAVPRRRLQLQQHPHTPSGHGLQMLGEVPSAPLQQVAAVVLDSHHQRQRVAITCSM